MISHLISITTSPTTAILLGLIYFCFDIVCPYGVVLYCYQKIYSFLFLAMSKFSRVIFYSFVAWNIHAVVFLPIFSFLVILVLLILRLSVLVAVMSLLLRIFMLMHWHNLQCWRVLFLLFLCDIYSLSTSSLGYKALCIVMNFLVLWSICLCSSLVYFKNGHGSLTSGTVQTLIPFMRFLS